MFLRFGKFYKQIESLRFEIFILRPEAADVIITNRGFRGWAIAELDNRNSAGDTSMKNIKGNKIKKKN